MKRKIIRGGFALIGVAAMVVIVAEPAAAYIIFHGT